MARLSPALTTSARRALSEAGRYGMEIREAADEMGYSRELAGAGLKHLFEEGEAVRERTPGDGAGFSWRYYDPAYAKYCKGGGSA